MALLKEDGSLDVERINKLPIDEYRKEIWSLTRKQYEEYENTTSKVIIRESQRPVQPVRVDYTLQNRLNSGAIIAEDLIKKIEKYINN